MLSSDTFLIAYLMGLFTGVLIAVVVILTYGRTEDE